MLKGTLHIGVVCIVLTISCLLLACSTTPNVSPVVLDEKKSGDVPRDEIDSTKFIIPAIIEIPSGTLEKWEMNKESGKIEWDQRNGENRIIDYLGYPGNYGMIPQTLLPKDQGGDGDPLDLLVLGPPANRGDLVTCKLIGVLKLLDGGEQDDKLIGIANNSTLFHVSSIEELNRSYPGVTDIISLWFANYKGKDIMKSNGYGDETEAYGILQMSRHSFKEINNK